MIRREFERRHTCQESMLAAHIGHQRSLETVPARPSKRCGGRKYPLQYPTLAQLPEAPFNPSASKLTVDLCPSVMSQKVRSLGGASPTIVVGMTITVAILPGRLSVLPSGGPCIWPSRSEHWHDCGGGENVVASAERGIGLDRRCRRGRRPTLTAGCYAIFPMAAGVGLGEISSPFSLSHP